MRVDEKGMRRKVIEGKRRESELAIEVVKGMRLVRREWKENVSMAVRIGKVKLCNQNGRLVDEGEEEEGEGWEGEGEESGVVLLSCIHLSFPCCVTAHV